MHRARGCSPGRARARARRRPPAECALRRDPWAVSPSIARAMPRAACEGWCSQWTCDQTDCLSCGFQHGCGKRNETEGIFECASYCDANLCWSDSCKDCQADEGCPRPPLPPSLPPPPLPPPTPPVAPPPRCTVANQIGASCMETRCCEDPSHTCFRKRGQRGSRFGYAVCMTSCPQNDDWDCEVITIEPPSPPPSGCSASFEGCVESHCCHSEEDGCFGRAGRQFAMCKPLQPYMSTGSCVSDDTWICPGEWDAPPLPPPPQPPPPPGAPPLPPRLPSPKRHVQIQGIGPRGGGDHSGSAPVASALNDNSGSFPSNGFGGHVRAKPSHGFKVLVAFALAGLTLCLLGLMVVLCSWARQRNSSKRKARVAADGDASGTGMKPASGTKAGKGGSKARYTRQLSADDVEGPEPDVNPDEVQESPSSSTKNQPSVLFDPDL